MAILRQVAFVPSEQECQTIANLVYPIDVWELPRVYGNLPQQCLLQDGTGKWFSIGSKYEDVEFKFECIELTIQRLQEFQPNLASAVRTTIQAHDLMVVFRADWVHPSVSDQKEDEWKRVTQDLSAVDEVPTRQLTGCLSWAGVLFGTPEIFEGLVYLDDFPMSIGFTRDRQKIDSLISCSRVIKHTKVANWIQQLRGWEIKLME
ncbi:MAG: hypothetical protein U0223_13285 [Nitrospira sp.]|nr:hypothetical protein [Nitrospira sp.]